MIRRELDGVRVSVACRRCAVTIKVPYRDAVPQGFACGCGEVVRADPVKISSAAIMDLLEAA